MDVDMETTGAAYKSHVPWIEKYRPETLDDLASHQDIKSTLEKFMSTGSLPHLLFYGPPGTGKTSTILACAKKLYSRDEQGNETFHRMVLELNASDDRGIDIVRGQILNFASTRGICSNGPKFKLIILDEADQMTNDAQSALRRIIEKYADNTRFCLITNYFNKIIPAIQSRCTRFRFGPLKPEQIIPRMDVIIKNEGLNMTENGKTAILELAEGDMRRVVNLIQSSAMSFPGEEINEEKVYQCAGQPLKEDITKIMEWLINKDMKTVYNDIQTLKLAKGLALQDIITQLSNYVGKITFPDEITSELYRKMADLEFYMNNGGPEKVYLSALISAFQGARETATS